MTRQLFHIQWKTWRNSLKSLETGNQVTLFLVAIIAIIFLILATTIMSGLAFVSGFSLIQNIVSVGSLLAFIFILLFGIPQVFKHLFSSRDLELLFTLPIPTKKVFWVKFAASFFGLPLVAWLFLFVPFIGVGMTHRLPLVYFLVIFIVSISTVLLGVSFSYLINLGLIQIIPARRTKELMTVMTGLAGLIIFVLFQIPNLLIGNEVNGSELVSSFTLPDWLPFTWVAYAVAEAGAGKIISLVGAGLYALVAVFFASLASTLVERGLRQGWIRFNEGSSKKKTKRTRTTRKLRSPVIVLGIKEWRSLHRDVREWLVLMPVAIFIIIFSIQFVMNGSDFRTILSDPMNGWLLAQLFLLFPFILILGPLTASAVAREGEATWILPTLPLSGMQIALGKFWMNWLIPVILFSVIELVLGIAFSWNPFLLLLAIVGFAIISCGMCGIGVWLGTIGAKYNPDNPQQRLQTGTGFLMMFLSIAYLIVGLFPLVFFLLPTDLAPFLSELVSQGGGGFLYWLITYANAVVSIKATSPVLSVLLGVIAMIFYSLGITSLTLFLASKRLIYGVNVTIEKGKRERLG